MSEREAGPSPRFLPALLVSVLAAAAALALVAVVFAARPFDARDLPVIVVAGAAQVLLWRQVRGGSGRWRRLVESVRARLPMALWAALDAALLGVLWTRGTVGWSGVDPAWSRVAAYAEARALLLTVLVWVAWRRQRKPVLSVAVVLGAALVWPVASALGEPWVADWNLGVVGGGLALAAAALAYAADERAIELLTPAWLVAMPAIALLAAAAPASTPPLAATGPFALSSMLVSLGWASVAARARASGQRAGT